MKIESTSISGAVIIAPDVFEDDRGAFFETFHAARYAGSGIARAFVQDNRSISRRGVLRGLHYQIRHPQGQLITLTRGTIFDVGVDLRRDSPTFKRVFTTTLSTETARQIYLPPGVAHGFYVLSDVAEIWYKCTDIYHADDEGGLLWSDRDLGIGWPADDPIVSPRDASYPRLKDIAADRLPHIER